MSGGLYFAEDVRTRSAERQESILDCVGIRVGFGEATSVKNIRSVAFYIAEFEVRARRSGQSATLGIKDNVVAEHEIKIFQFKVTSRSAPR